MSVYVVKEVGSGPTSFICSVPTEEMAWEQVKGLIRTDRELGCYRKGRYGVIKREYCPGHVFDCRNYMMGICSLKKPAECNSYVMGLIDEVMEGDPDAANTDTPEGV